MLKMLEILLIPQKYKGNPQMPCDKSYFTVNGYWLLPEPNGLALEMLEVFIPGKVFYIIKCNQVGLATHFWIALGQPQILILNDILYDLPDRPGIAKVFIPVIV